MDFLLIQGFDVPSGKQREYQEWVRANFDALASSAPEGIELVGIYGRIFSSEKHSGSYQKIWRLDSYGALDRFSAAVGGEGEFARLLEEGGAFIDVRLEADWSNQLLKSVKDTTIWADNPEE